MSILPDGWWTISPGSETPCQFCQTVGGQLVRVVLRPLRLWCGKRKGPDPLSGCLCEREGVLTASGSFFNTKSIKQVPISAILSYPEPPCKEPVGVGALHPRNKPSNIIVPPTGSLICGTQSPGENSRQKQAQAHQGKPFRQRSM